jgi:hypothetical protein
MFWPERNKTERGREIHGLALLAGAHTDNWLDREDLIMAYSALFKRDLAMKRISWGFCINRFLMSPLHYLSSPSDFGFEFAEIFVIEKQLSWQDFLQLPFFKILN